MALDRNDPEVKALLEEAISAATEALSAKNRELLGEVKTLKAKAKGADIDPAEHAALQSKVEELTDALDKATKTSKAEVEKLTKALSTKDAALTQHLIDAGLTDALAKAGVAPHYLTAAKAMFKGQAALKAEGDQYQALIGDKPLADAIAAWAQSDEGKHFVAAPASSGGGASGGASGGAGKPTQKTVTRQAWDQMGHADRATFAKDGGKVIDT
ncbi:MAG TPA: hypothetical protein VN324_00865 [Quisquiliibacterium sp.]|nr:hypothetical protein [Quisquiliibacterium sp.]